MVVFRLRREFSEIQHQSEVALRPDLIHLAIPGFILLIVAKAIFGEVMRPDLYERIWRDLRKARSLRSKLIVVSGTPGARRFNKDTSASPLLAQAQPR